MKRNTASTASALGLLDKMRCTAPSNGFARDLVPHIGCPVTRLASLAVEKLRQSAEKMPICAPLLAACPSVAMQACALLACLHVGIQAHQPWYSPVVLTEIRAQL